MGEKVRNVMRLKEQEEVKRWSHSPISNFKSSTFFMDMDGQVSNMDVMGQDNHAVSHLKPVVCFVLGLEDPKQKLDALNG